MKRIAITGSLGLVGSEAVKFFLDKGWEVSGIDSNMRHKFFGTQKQSGYRTLDIDIRDVISIDSMFKHQKFDAIIHAAAQPSHDYATDHVLEDFDINARGTVILLEAARKYCPEAPFVYVSTDKVYGENMSTYLVEEETRYSAPNRPVGFDENLKLDLAGDRSFFGCSKLAGDLYAQQYAARFGMKVGVFRPGCITGKNHQGAEQHGFLAYLVKCIKEGKTYNIYGYKGKQVRDQIHAHDLVSAFNYFIQSPNSNPVYNMGGGPERSVSVLEAGELISKEVGKPFLYEFHEARRGDRLWDIHDVSKFRKDYPEWHYEYSLSDIIKDLCEKV